MKLSSTCIRCIMDKQEERVRDMGNEVKKSAYLKEVAGIIAFAEPFASAPYLLYRINKIFKKYFGDIREYEKEKQEFNTIMLEMEQELRDRIHEGSGAEAILKNAINYSRAANYIDFGAMNNVSKEQLVDLLERARDDELDGQTLQMLSGDLAGAGELVILADNCGEIVADKLLAEVLAEQYPTMGITVIVRGAPVLNDATIEDAVTVGLTKIVKVMDNGNGVPGTQIDVLSAEARNCLGKADLILSKGQANFETLYDCGLNIYYLFLCKCEWFSTRFGMEKYKGVFVNERNLKL